MSGYLCRRTETCPEPWLVGRGLHQGIWTAWTADPAAAQVFPTPEAATEGWPEGHVRAWAQAEAPLAPPPGPFMYAADQVWARARAQAALYGHYGRPAAEAEALFAAVHAAAVARGRRPFTIPPAFAPSRQAPAPGRYVGGRDCDHGLRPSSCYECQLAAEGRPPGVGWVKMVLVKEALALAQVRGYDAYSLRVWLGLQEVFETLTDLGLQEGSGASVSGL